MKFAAPMPSVAANNITPCDTENPPKTGNMPATPMVSRIGIQTGDMLRPSATPSWAVWTALESIPYPAQIIATKNTNVL